jgi:hypothetical protein
MLLLALACSTPPPASPPQTSALVAASPVEPGETGAHGVGALVFVPAWSSVYVGDGNRTFDLTVTLAVRNTDLDTPITVTSVRYFDAGGKLLHAYVESPTTLAPLASAATVVRESDTRAGVGGSFLVEWSAATEVTDPVVEAVMIGSAYQQGISFVREGRVLERRPTPSPR